MIQEIKSLQKCLANISSSDWIIFYTCNLLCHKDDTVRALYFYKIFIHKKEKKIILLNLCEVKPVASSDADSRCLESVEKQVL